MMSYGDQRPKSFQGERFAKIMSHAKISKVKLSIKLKISPVDVTQMTIAILLDLH